MKLSALMQVYNEERCLPCSLPGILAVVDECVIVDGGAVGPSSDGSKAIIDKLDAEYPGKIVYISGTYIRDDGAWDEPKQINEGISRITGDYLMRITADMVMDETDVRMVRDIVEKFSDKKYFYAPCIDFGIDTNHIILQHSIEFEKQLLREICNPDAAVVVSMSANPRAIEIGEHRTFGMTADIDYGTDILYMPHVKRFHYGYVKPFSHWVAKYIRCVYKGDYGIFGQELQEAGHSTILETAIEWAMELPDTLPIQPYAGTYPINGEPLRAMHIMEGYEEFMQALDDSYKVPHSVPNKSGCAHEKPSANEIQSLEHETIALFGQIDGQTAGLAAHERFLVEAISACYPDPSLIDLGCGNGKFLICAIRDEYIRKGTGVDALSGILENARSSATDVNAELTFIASTIEGLELEKKYDVVTCIETLEHLYNASIGVKKAAALLVSGGMFCGTVPVENTTDCKRHRHYFSRDSLTEMLNYYFEEVAITDLDFSVTEVPEDHLGFVCRNAKGIQ